MVGQGDCMSSVDNGGLEGLGWVGCVDRDGWEAGDWRSIGVWWALTGEN